MAAVQLANNRGFKWMQYSSRTTGVLNGCSRVPEKLVT